MLPNHAPLTIAEQFGTLGDAAPGPHRPRPRARAGQRPEHDARAAPRPDRRPTRFPQDVLELQGYLTGDTRIAGRQRHPRQGHQRAALHPRVVAVRREARRACSACRTRSPRTSRPAPCSDAVAMYRREFAAVRAARRAVRDRRRERASPPTPRPMRRSSSRPSAAWRVARFLGGDRDLTDDEADAAPALAAGPARSLQMMQYTAVGTPQMVREYLDEFAAHADADELIVAHASPTIEQRLRSVDLCADVCGLQRRRRRVTDRAWHDPSRHGRRRRVPPV